VTVLVADDNDVALRLCRRLLEKAGYKVLTASDAQEAVSLALANSPEVILLDDAMPGMNSLQAMRRIKERRPGIAVVIASVDPSSWNRERFLMAGAEDVLTKPFRLSDVVAVVAKLTDIGSAKAPISDRRTTIPDELRRTVGQATEIAAALTGQFPISPVDGKPQFDFGEAAASVHGFQHALIETRRILGEIARAHGAFPEYIPDEEVDAWSRARLVPGTELNELPLTAFLATRKSSERLFALARSIELETDLASKEQRDWTWTGAESMFTTQARSAMQEFSLCNWDELIQGAYVHELVDQVHALIGLVQHQLQLPPKPNRPADDIRRPGSAHEEHVYGAYRWCAVCGWIELMAVPTGVHTVNRPPSEPSASQSIGARSQQNSGGLDSSRELNDGLRKAMERFINLMRSRNSDNAAVSADPPLSGTDDVGAGGHSPTVLIADDNDVALRLCRRVLQKAGYGVLTAADGLEAVSVALANSPDVILMDVAMPGIDGLEATRRIKQQKPGIAIVIASVLATASNRERFLASGADDVMMKPLRLTDMLAAVARLTANRGPQTKGHTSTRLGSDETVEPTVKWARDQLEESTQHQLRELNRIGIALTAERDTHKLQDLILTTMRRLTNADGASLWLKTGGDDGQPKLFLSASQNTSINNPYQAFKVPLDEKSIVGYAVMNGSSLVYDDAYNPPPGKPQAGKGFDAQYDYRTKSMLTVPIRNYDNDVVGVVQLINAKRSFETRLTVDNVPDEVVSFRPEDLEMIESIASQAAVALGDNNRLNSIEALFDGFVRTSLSALELRDPTAASRSYRVEALTTGLARAVSRIEAGKYREVRLTDDQFKELRYACLLHDIGKIGVREHILIKAKKLLPGQLDVIQARFDFIVRSVQVTFATEKLEVMRNGKGKSQKLENIDSRLAREIHKLHMWLAAIIQANEPSVLPEDTASILEQLSKQTYQDLSGALHPMLEPQEYRFLSIRKGVLDPEERLEMESHVTHGFELVSNIPWPSSMRNIPEIVYTHHERLDGSGYPRGLTGDQISLQTRMLTIADIYDALTAQDRPYRRAVSSAAALEILRAEANAGMIDSDLVDVFVANNVFLIKGG
jgi:response regulator RpfG family c-di-GMP phosphodiesterase